MFDRHIPLMDEIITGTSTLDKRKRKRRRPGNEVGRIALKENVRQSMKAPERVGN